MIRVRFAFFIQLDSGHSADPGAAEPASEDKWTEPKVSASALVLLFVSFSFVDPQFDVGFFEKRA